VASGETSYRSKEQRMNDFVMSYDERVVRERIGVVRDLLQAQRVRQGALAADANAPLRLALASFVDRARSEGWTRAFDEVLTAAQKAVSDGSETAKISKIVEYLVEVEPYIVRLAQTKRSTNTSEENVATTNAVLRASTGGVPALHRMQGFGTASLSERWAPDFVEPGALIQLHALSRDVLDELASLALLRAPGLDEPWTIGAGFEERLLNMLDAAVALSRGAISLDIVRAARSRAEASPVAEPYRWFVPTFLLACTDGERAMDALRETLLEAPEGMFEGLVDAVCLGSNPDRATIAMSLLDEDDRPEILCGALDILVRLGKPIEGRLVELVEHPNLDVATRAAMAVSLTVDTQSAVRTLRPLLAEDDRSTFIACVLTTIAPEIGAPHLREVVRRGTKEGASEVETDQAVQAAEILAALGQTRDSQQLIALAGVSDDACRALATLGTPEALEFLRASPPQPPLQLRADGAAWRGGAGKTSTLVPPLHVALQSNSSWRGGTGV
jgi:hypothetical protein